MTASELIELMAPLKTRSRMGSAISNGYLASKLIYEQSPILKNVFGMQALGHIQYVCIQTALQELSQNNLLPKLHPFVSENERKYKFLELKDVDGHSISVARANDPSVPGRYARVRERRFLTNYIDLFPEFKIKDERKGFLLMCFGGKGFDVLFGKIGVPSFDGKEWVASQPLLNISTIEKKSEISDILDPRKLAENSLEVIVNEIKKPDSDNNSF